MIWDILNTFGRLILTAVAFLLITQLRHMLNLAERTGLGMMSSGSFLTIGVIWEGVRSPFDGWSVTLLTYGSILFLSGFAYRKLRHDTANRIQRRAAARHLQSRGKL